METFHETTSKTTQITRCTVR